jgi:hypothetical protein
MDERRGSEPHRVSQQKAQIGVKPWTPSQRGTHRRETHSPRLDSLPRTTFRLPTPAEVNCEKNADPGGPLSATYTLVRDKTALDAAFNDIVRASTRVNCPGNIQSPGPWRRNATPHKTSGVLFCGIQESRPTVAWTDDDDLLVSTIQSGPQGPTFDQLYEWWSSHS